MARKYVNGRYRFSIEIPYGWRVHDGWLAKVLNWYQEVEVRFSPHGHRYPELAIHVRPTKMHGAEEVRELMLGVARSMKVPIIEHKPCTIDKVDGYAIAYSTVEQPGAMEVYRSAVIYGHWYYLFQLSSDNVREDRAAMEQCLATFQFMARPLEQEPA